MQPNTLVRLPDGREARVVYHNLDGYGIKWGRAIHDEDNLPPPDALLREPFRTADWPCVGSEYEVVDEETGPSGGSSHV